MSFEAILSIEAGKKPYHAVKKSRQNYPKGTATSTMMILFGTQKVVIKRGNLRLRRSAFYMRYHAYSSRLEEVDCFSV